MANGGLIVLGFMFMLWAAVFVGTGISVILGGIFGFFGFVVLIGGIAAPSRKKIIAKRAQASLGAAPPTPPPRPIFGAPAAKVSATCPKCGGPTEYRPQFGRNVCARCQT